MSAATIDTGALIALVDAADVQCDTVGACVSRLWNCDDVEMRMLFAQGGKRVSDCRTVLPLPGESKFQHWYERSVRCIVFAGAGDEYLRREGGHSKNLRKKTRTSTEWKSMYWDFDVRSLLKFAVDVIIQKSSRPN